MLCLDDEEVNKKIEEFISGEFQHHHCSIESRRIQFKYLLALNHFYNRMYEGKRDKNFFLKRIGEIVGEVVLQRRSIQQ